GAGRGCREALPFEREAGAAAARARILLAQLLHQLARLLHRALRLVAQPIDTGAGAGAAALSLTRSSRLARSLRRAGGLRVTGTGAAAAVRVLTAGAPGRAVTRELLQLIGHAVEAIAQLLRARDLSRELARLCVLAAAGGRGGQFVGDLVERARDLLLRR